MHISREKGFTLLELLASIVLIGIIFTALFHFLGQNIFMSASVEEQYITAQLAERELEEWKMKELIIPSSFNDQVTYKDDIEKNNTVYDVKVMIYANAEEIEAGLYRLRVKVEDPESGRSSVAYGWYTE